MTRAVCRSLPDVALPDDDLDKRKHITWLRLSEVLVGLQMGRTEFLRLVARSEILLRGEWIRPRGRYYNLGRLLEWERVERPHDSRGAKSGKFLRAVGKATRKSA